MTLLSPEELISFDRQYRPPEESTSPTSEIGGYSVCRYIVKNEEKLSIASTVKGAPPLIELLPQLLTWCNAESFLSVLNYLRARVAEIRLQRALDSIRAVDDECYQHLQGLMSALPAWAVVRFTGAPAMQKRLPLLRKDPIQQIKFFHDSLKAELCLNGKTVPARGYWTALGDFYIADGMKNLLDLRESAWNSHMNFRAPRLQGVITVDGISPNSQEINSPPLVYECYTPAEFAMAVEKLQESLAATLAISKAAGQLVRELIKVIIVLKTKAGGLGSSSHYTSAGQVVIRNPHCSHLAPVISALVHEAIHQVLYIIESCGRFIDDRSASSQPMVQSPWTNRNLPLHSYLHACFVWYGLANFWRYACNSTLLPAASIHRQLDEALLGFRSANPADRLLPYRSAISADALASVASLGDHLHRAGGSDLPSMADHGFARLAPSTVSTA